MLEATSNEQQQYGADADWGVLDGGAHWRHLANTTEPSVCGGDAALCQITLTTCCLFILSSAYSSIIQFITIIAVPFNS